MSAKNQFAQSWWAAKNVCSNFVALQICFCTCLVPVCLRTHRCTLELIVRFGVRLFCDKNACRAWTIHPNLFIIPHFLCYSFVQQCDCSWSNARFAHPALMTCSIPVVTGADPGRTWTVEQKFPVSTTQMFSTVTGLRVYIGPPQSADPPKQNPGSSHNKQKPDISSLLCF